MNRIMLHRFTRLKLASIVALLTSFGAQASVSYRTVAQTGDDAGASLGIEFSNLFVQPTINDSGQVAFLGALTGIGVNSTNDTGVWSDSSGSLEMIAREGGIAPGTGGLVYGSRFNSLILNDVGSFVFHADLNGFGNGIWMYQDGVLMNIERSGDVALGTNGSTFGGITEDQSALNNSGEVVFRSVLSGPDINTTNNTGVWSAIDGIFSLVVREGNPVPGMGDTVYGGISAPMINTAGQIMIQGGLSGPNTDITNNIAIWLIDSDSQSILARTGNIAPGTNGARFSHFTSLPLMNEAGQVTFRGLVTGIDVDESDMEGIWTGDFTSLRLVARSGAVAPGAGSASFCCFFGPTINQPGQTLFKAQLAGDSVDPTNDMGVWVDENGTLSLLIRRGDAAPGIDSSVFNTIDGLMLNDPGQVAFYGTVIGENIDGTNDVGLWATDTAEELQLIVRTGSLFDVNNDPLVEDLRTVSGINMIFDVESGGGQARAFNNSGQLAFSLIFTDSTHGVFVATVSAGLSGDVNGDNAIGGKDLDIILANWGDVVGQQAVASGDLSGDGIIGQADLAIVIANWGIGTPPDVVPEPGSIVLLTLGGLALFRRRR